jgi:hypothetical protein
METRPFKNQWPRLHQKTMYGPTLHQKPIFNTEPEDSKSSLNLMSFDSFFFKL